MKLFLVFPFVSILAQTFSISQTGYESHQSHLQILDSNLLNPFLSLSSLRQVQLHHFSLQRFLWCLIIYKILAQVPYNSSQLLGSKWFYIFLTWIQIIFQCLPLNHCITAFWNLWIIQIAPLTQIWRILKSSCFFPMKLT